MKGGVTWSTPYINPYLVTIQDFTNPIDRYTDQQQGFRQDCLRGGGVQKGWGVWGSKRGGGSGGPPPGVFKFWCLNRENILIFLANKGGYPPPPPCGAEWGNLEPPEPPLAETLNRKKMPAGYCM